MKDLVYTVALGQRRFRWAADLAVRCLRGPGAFTGDVTVFTSAPAEMSGDAQVIQIDDSETLVRANLQKMRARHAFAFSQYDRVLFLDADIAIRAPVARYFDAVSETGQMVCVDDMRNTILGGHCSRYLTEAERAEHAELQGVNGGFFAAPGDRLAGWLADWETTILSSQDMPGSGYDQPGINACRVRGQIPIHVLSGRMWFPKRDAEMQLCDADADLVHFHGIGRHIGRYFRMRRFARSLGV